MGEPESSGTAAARPLAVVTGASSGIGKAFAKRLARDGYDLVLVARRQNRLDALAEELKSAHGARSEIIIADLAVNEGLQTVVEKLNSAPVELLVNNAGIQDPKRFAEGDPDVWDTMVRLQCLAPVRLTRAVLPAMLARKSGGVINVASIAGFLPLPNSVLYSSVKRFLIGFTEALRQELSGSGVTAQALCPGWTRTELVDRPDVDTSHITEAWWSEPEDVVDASLKAFRKGKFIVIPGWRNRAMISATRMTVRPLLRWMLRTFKKNQVEMKK